MTGSRQGTFWVSVGHLSRTFFCSKWNGQQKGLFFAKKYTARRRKIAAQKGMETQLAAAGLPKLGTASQAASSAAMLKAGTTAALVATNKNLGEQHRISQVHVASLESKFGRFATDCARKEEAEQVKWEAQRATKESLRAALTTQESKLRIADIQQRQGLPREERAKANLEQLRKEQGWSRPETKLRAECPCSTRSVIVSTSDLQRGDHDSAAIEQGNGAVGGHAAHAVQCS